MEFPDFRRKPAECLYLIDEEHAQFAAQAARFAQDVSVEVVAEYGDSQGYYNHPERITAAADAWAAQEAAKPDNMDWSRPESRLARLKIMAITRIVTENAVMLRFVDQVGRKYVDLGLWHQEVDRMQFEAEHPGEVRRFRPLSRYEFGVAKRRRQLEQRFGTDFGTGVAE